MAKDDLEPQISQQPSPAQPGQQQSQTPTPVELFKVLDPQGWTITLDSERWQHIVNGHPEMATFLPKLQETITTPEIIQQDRKRSETHYYYRLSGRSLSRQKDIYVNAVVARYEATKTGFVKTAFLVATIRKHGEDYVWLNRK